MKRQKRFEKLEKRPINMDTFFVEWPEGGLSAIDSPYDPKPSIKVKNGVITEMDGKAAADFDSIEMFISRYGINVDLAQTAMSIPSEEIARMLVDVNVKRDDIITITTAITPAKMLEVLKCLNSVETMMAQMKMRKRARPANQAHVTNILDNPVLMAADAAEAAARGFAEIETTCAVSRYAPLNAISIMVGGLSVRPGVLTQCSMEEALEVKMGMRGITSYAETISLYGTEKTMDDGGDTVWSKGFLASVYASRGVKMRCTSGTGSEVLMGGAEKKSMLYLELLCVYMAKACGVQGIQNGSISCIGITSAVPKGFLAMALENLAVSMLDMEVASGNDQTFTHSDLRRTSKLLMQMLAGTDFITSGYSAVPNLDDVFAGSNTDCDDYDDWYMIQRDMKVDGGIEPITEQNAINVRNRAGKALQAVFRELNFPPITDEEIEAAVYAYSNEEMPPRNRAKDMEAATEFLEGDLSAIDIIKALNNSGFNDVADNILMMQKERIGGDYLQVSSIFDENNHILSGLNNQNDYSGPGTGYQIPHERWKKLSNKESALIPENILETQRAITGFHGLYKSRVAGNPGPDEADIIVGVSPGFCDLKLGVDVCKSHIKVLENLLASIEECGCTAQIVKVYDTANLGDIAKKTSCLGKYNISIALQINGRVYIHDGRKQQDEAVRGYYNMVMSSPELYRDLGRLVVDYARSNGKRAIEPHRCGTITDYQLKMVRVDTDENQFVKEYKEMEKLYLD